MNAKALIEDDRMAIFMAFRDEFTSQLVALTAQVARETKTDITRRVSGIRNKRSGAMSSGTDMTYCAVNVFMWGPGPGLGKVGELYITVELRDKEPSFALYHTIEVMTRDDEPPVSNLWRSSPGPASLALFETLGEIETRLRKLATFAR